MTATTALVSTCGGGGTKDGGQVNPLEQPCATCKWAKLDMTKHNPPRINYSTYGECTWPLPPLILIAKCYSVDRKPHKSAIWPKNTGCPVWEAK